MDLRDLTVLGITYNQIEPGVYALLLQETGGRRRLPIVIGSGEAQSIECCLQKVITPRPLTHDLMVNMMRRFGLRLTKVVIHQIEDGIFAANLHLIDPYEHKEVQMDARSSDAVALALRLHVPILAESELLDKIGLLAPDPRRAINQPRPAPTTNRDVRLTTLSDDRLKELMNQAVEKEAYELAAKIKAELDRRGVTE